MGLDIGPKTIAQFSAEIAKARTIVWNGPLGMFEKPAFAQGTLAIARAVAAATASWRHVDHRRRRFRRRRRAVRRRHQISHISTGGGASLEFLAGEKLPGVEALTNKARVSGQVEGQGDLIAPPRDRRQLENVQDAAETRAFFDAFLPLVAASRHCDIVVAPPFTALAAAVEAARGSAITIAAQNVHWEPEGAFTGEISARMLVEAGCRAVIIGHSERRQYFSETDESVNRKTKAALEAGLTPIVCVGETLSEREANQTEAVLKRQFEDGLAALTAAEFSRILVGVRAGLGNRHRPNGNSGNGGGSASLHSGAGRNSFTSERAAALRILYGGSVKPDNIRGLMAQAEIDGALVGGASLDPKSFAAIVNF